MLPIPGELVHINLFESRVARAIVSMALNQSKKLKCLKCKIAEITYSNEGIGFLKELSTITIVFAYVSLIPNQKGLGGSLLTEVILTVKG